jgi:hypothetical protein
MAISAVLEARSTSILNNLENLARNANKGAHKLAKKPASQGDLTPADKLIIRVFQKQEKLAKAMLDSYADRLEEFRIKHDEEGFAVTLESANAECEKMRRVFKKSY